MYYYNFTRSIKCLWDLGHIFTFALWTYLLLLIYPKIATISFSKLSTAILTSAGILGILTEFAQHWVDGRTPSYSDLSKDIIGSAMVLVFSSSSKKIVSTSTKIILRIIVLFIFLCQLWPLTKALTDEKIAAVQFPVIASFETPFETERWSSGNKTTITADKSSPSNHVLKIVLVPGKYSGIGLKHFPGNWQGYKNFEFDIKNNVDNTIKLTCRIHDAKHIKSGQKYTDRFNKRLIIEPGWQHIVISIDEIINAPLGRKIDITMIMGVGLFASNLTTNQTIHIDNVRLSR